MEASVPSLQTLISSPTSNFILLTKVLLIQFIMLYLHSLTIMLWAMTLVGALCTPAGLLASATSFLPANLATVASRAVSARGAENLTDPSFPAPILSPTAQPDPRPVPQGKCTYSFSASSPSPPSRIRLPFPFPW